MARIEANLAQLEASLPPRTAARGGRARESAYEKLAITLPRALAKAVREGVQARQASSVSAFIAEAVEEKLERDRLQEVMDQMDAEYGPLTPEELAWADRILLGD